MPSPTKVPFTTEVGVLYQDTSSLVPTRTQQNRPSGPVGKEAPPDLLSKNFWNSTLRVC